MKIVLNVEDMKRTVPLKRDKGKKIGFVPTMGFLHEGHLSLVRKSVQTVDWTVVSIFVNPAQFGPKEDFEEYPRNFHRDINLLKKEGVDCVFLPSKEEIYPAGYCTYVEVHGLQDKLCGITRPDFFRGVCTVVLKLFHIVKPDVSFFGQKDAQQAIILKKMVEDLNLDVKIEVLPLIRDEDGLALSSRNSYLNAEQRKAAFCLSQSLKKARALVDEGEKDAARIIQKIREVIEDEPLARIDYVEIVDSGHLEPLQEVKKGALIALAVFVDNTRLIDNIIV